MGVLCISLVPLVLRGRRITGIQFEYHAGVKGYVKKFPEGALEPVTEDFLHSFFEGRQPGVIVALPLEETWIS